MTAETRQADTLSKLRQPSPLGLYGSIIRGRLVPYSVGISAMIVTSASEVLIPKTMQYGIDLLAQGEASRQRLPGYITRVLPPDPGSSLTVIVCILVTLMTCGMVGRFGWRQFLARQTHEVGNALKIGIWDALRFQPIHTFRRYPLGDLMNRAIGDWQATRVIFGFTLVLVFDVIFFTAFAVIAMLLIDVPLTILTLATFLGASPIIGRLAKKEHDQHEVAQEHLSVLSDAITQSLRSIRFQRATHSESAWQQQLARFSDIYRAARLTVIQTAWKIFPWSSLPALLSYAVLATMGISRVQSGDITPGQLVALCSFVLLMQSPLLELGDCIAELQKGFASLRRMQEILNLEPPSVRYLAETPMPPLEPAHLAIAFEEVSFAYPNKAPLLQGANWKVPTGTIAGLIGPVGVGKSTLLHLLTGFEHPIEGIVRVLGEDVMTVPKDWFAVNISMVPQSSFLFAGSVRDNLLLGSTVPDDELWQILEAVAIAEEVRRMPRALDTNIGEWGINLSGGQKQRLALARALLRKRPLLLLDDCLSAVDSVTEEYILEHMLQNTEQTVIWAAHRASTLRHCDSVWTIRNQEIIDVTAEIRGNSRD